MKSEHGCLAAFAADGGGAENGRSPRWAARGVAEAAGAAGGRLGPRGAGCRAVGAVQVALVVTTVLVDATAPLLQERASRGRGFEGADMVLAETMSYFLGGLALAVASGGLSGFWRCVRPARYVAFLPASAAFSTSNFLTYVAVRGLGASQFYLLAQLRFGVLSVILRLWSGVRQPPLAWLALVQLAVGMSVLVYFKANVGLGCAAGLGGLEGSARGSLAEGLLRNTTASLEGMRDGALGAGAAAAGLAGGGTFQAAALAAAAKREELLGAVAALVGVVFTSAMGFIYLEWQLKSHAQDPLFVQLHQMNSFGAAVSLAIHLGEGAGEGPLEAGALGEAAGAQLHVAAAAVAAAQAAAAGALAGPARPGAAWGNASVLARNATSAALRAAAAAAAPAAEAVAGAAAAAGRGASAGPAGPPFAILLSCIVFRGVLGGSVLKQLDSVAKGLIDITAIIVCTGLQFSIDGNIPDGTIIGIEALMLLSIMSYIVARSSGASVMPLGGGGQQMPVLDLIETSARRASAAPKAL